MPERAASPAQAAQRTGTTLPGTLRTGIRRTGSRLGGWISGASYLQKWLLLGVLIGLIAGIGAVVFFTALVHATDLLIEGIGGYTQPATANEPPTGPVTRVFTDYARPWAIPLVVCGGAAVSAALIAWLAPAAEGHGTDAAIEAIHTNPRRVRVRTVAVKIVASALTIGSGGSGGREGPTAQISAGFGSLLTRYFDLRASDGRIALAVGVGSGIGAIFSAPLGGAVLAASIAYRNDFDNRVLVPGFIASITAFAVFGSVEGFDPIFGNVAAGYSFDNALDLAWFAVIGVIGGITGIAYATGFRGASRLFNRMARPARWTHVAKTALGGLLTGLLALAIPQVLGSGYGWAQQMFDRGDLMSLPLWLILVLPGAKILATAFSIGSGGSGGLFGPGIVVGAFAGGAVWRLGEALGIAGVPDSPAPFVVVGMMACFGSISRAPLAIMLMVAEMTSGFGLLIPAMVAVGLSYLMVRQTGQTMYTAQLGSREDEYSSSVGGSLPLLAAVPVADALRPPRLVLDESTPWPEAAASMTQAGVRGAPVVDGTGRFIGVVRTPDGTVDRQGEPSAASVGQKADVTAPTIPAGANLDAAYEALRAGDGWLPVLGPDRRVRGTVAAGDLVRAYRAAITRDRRRFRDVSAHAGVEDVVVPKKTAADAAVPDESMPDAGTREAPPPAGATLAGAPLPRGVIVIRVRRGDTLLPVVPETTFEPGDILTLLGDPDAVASVRARWEGD